MFEFGRNEETRKCGKMYYDTLAVYNFYWGYLFVEDEVGELCCSQKCLVWVRYCLGMLSSSSIIWGLHNKPEVAAVPRDLAVPRNLVPPHQ
jgi:hypothetical protein